MKTKWNRPNGTSIEINETPAAIAYVESLGWTRAKKAPAKKAKKRTK